jgi:hypothetical protein
MITNKKGIAILVLVILLIVLLVVFFYKPKDETENSEKLNLFDSYDTINPIDTTPFFQKAKNQTYNERQIQMKKASLDYLKQYGGPFGQGDLYGDYKKQKEKYQVELPEFKDTIKDGGIMAGPKFQRKIKSSKDYGFLSKPPKDSVTTKAFSEYPSQKSASGPFLYNVIKSNTCSIQPQNIMIGMIVDTCDSLCSHDNQCMAYNYDFSNGNCEIFTQCPGLKKSAKLSKLFVKNMKIKM